MVPCQADNRHHCTAQLFRTMSTNLHSFPCRLQELQCCLPSEVCQRDLLPAADVKQFDGAVGRAGGQLGAIVVQLGIMLWHVCVHSQHDSHISRHKLHTSKIRILTHLQLQASHIQSQKLHILSQKLHTSQFRSFTHSESEVSNTSKPEASHM